MSKANIVLTKNQWARISEILGNGGLLVLASTVIPAIFDNLNLLLIVLGLVIAGVLIYASIVSAEKY